jgi:hypothetical protein
MAEQLISSRHQGISLSLQLGSAATLDSGSRAASPAKKLFTFSIEP